jgi:hypothetical protein
METGMADVHKLTERYKRVPMAEITTPPSGTVMVYKDHWWAVTENDEVLLWDGHSPQCNVNKSIVERLSPEGCRPVFIPVAFKRINPSDYVY